LSDGVEVITLEGMGEGGRVAKGLDETEKSSMDALGGSGTGCTILFADEVAVILVVLLLLFNKSGVVGSMLDMYFRSRGPLVKSRNGS
jgi:hypothetical protein